MAHEQHQGLKFPKKVGTAAIGPKVPVAFDTSGGGDVLAIATNNVRPLGVTIATCAANRAGAIYGAGNTVKALANASLGVGAEVGIASSNGSLGPVSGASGVTRWSVGLAESAAGAGETFSLLVNPRQLSNLI